jgi:alkylation response protein AidB-like acyl-CoA dehydrogenase
MLSVLLGGALDPEAGAAEGKIVALAWRERARGFDPSQVETRVEGGRITGRKVHVLDGTRADSFVVSAVEDGEIGLYRVAADAVERTALTRVDHRDAAHVGFEGAPAVRITGGIEELTQALDQAAVALAAEMLGGAAAALEMTLGYLCERVQFGVPIGSFQALQHRAVDSYVELELARVTVAAAAREPTALRVSLAKTQCNDAYLRISKDAIQLHGGIGMTDEHDIGFHLKRAMVAAKTLGSSAWHRDRWGRLRGY